MLVEKLDQVKRGAFMFARITRDADEIAKALRVTPRTVYRLLDRDDFNTELDVLGYEGERSFRIQPRGKGKRKPRQPSEEKKSARELWHSLDIPEPQRATAIAEQTGMSVRTIRGWIREWTEYD